MLQSECKFSTNQRLPTRDRNSHHRWSGRKLNGGGDITRVNFIPLCSQRQKRDDLLGTLEILHTPLCSYNISARKKKVFDNRNCSVGRIQIFWCLESYLTRSIKFFPFLPRTRQESPVVCKSNVSFPSDRITSSTSISMLASICVVDELPDCLESIPLSQ